MSKPLAICHAGHTMARATVKDGEAAIEYSAEVAGLAARTGGRGGKFNLGATLSTMTLDEIDAENQVLSASVYCKHCHENYWLELNAAVNVLKTGGKPIVLTKN